MKYLAWLETDAGYSNSRHEVLFECDSDDPDIVEEEARQAVMNLISWGFTEYEGV